MPFTVHIDPEAGLVTCTASGDPDPNESLEAMDSIFHSPDFRPGMNFLCDFRQRTGRALQDSNLRRLAENAKVNLERRGGGRNAFLVSDLERLLS